VGLQGPFEVSFKTVGQRTAFPDNDEEVFVGAFDISGLGGSVEGSASLRFVTGLVSIVGNSGNALVVEYPELLRAGGVTIGRGDAPNSNSSLTVTMPKLKTVEGALSVSSNANLGSLSLGSLSTVEGALTFSSNGTGLPSATQAVVLTNLIKVDTVSVTGNTRLLAFDMPGLLTLVGNGDPDSPDFVFRTNGTQVDCGEIEDLVCPITPNPIATEVDVAQGAVTCTPSCP